MAAAVIQDSAFGSKRNATAITFGILLPIVRILERVRIPLILGKLAGWRSWGGCACRSWRWFFHHWQRQDLALDGFKFGGVAPGVRRSAAEPFNFFIHALDAMFRIRVVGAKLRKIFSLGLRLEFFEELGLGPPIVSCIVKNLGSHDVGLRFRRARITQQHAARREIAQCRQKRAARAVSENCAEDSQPGFSQHCFGGLVSAVAQRDVRQLMRHHCGELRFIIRGFDRAAVYEHISARQRKSIDGFVVHAMKFERILHTASCFCASVAARLPRVMSSCGENLFQPGLREVLCADASGIKSNDSPRKRQVANLECALEAHTGCQAFPLRRSHFDPRMPTSTSEKTCEEGWHSFAKGYFSTQRAAKKKPGRSFTRA